MLMEFIEGASKISPVYYVSGNHEAWSGEYRTINKSTMVVNRGLGNSIIPIRIFNRPEIIKLVLKRE